jgi:hypothetical protein
VLLIWRFRSLRKSYQNRNIQKFGRKPEITAKPHETESVVDREEMVPSAQSYEDADKSRSDQRTDGELTESQERTEKNLVENHLLQPTPQVVDDDLSVSDLPPAKLTRLTETPTRPSLVSTMTDIQEEGVEVSDSVEEIPSTDKQTTPSDELERIIQYDQSSRRSKTWNMVGASVRGTSHVKLNLPCQDYHDYRVVAHEVILAAVADGLGSASKSNQGAKLAVDTVLNSLDTLIRQSLPDDEQGWEKIIRVGFTQARNELEKIAQSAGDPLRFC